MSFLNDPASLKETVDFLNHHGCEQQTSRFRSVVESYYAEDFPLDRSKFPKATDGFYSVEDRGFFSAGGTLLLKET